MPGESVPASTPSSLDLLLSYSRSPPQTNTNTARGCNPTPMLRTDCLCMSRGWVGLAPLTIDEAFCCRCPPSLPLYLLLSGDTDSCDGNKMDVAQDEVDVKNEGISISAGHIVDENPKIIEYGKSVLTHATSEKLQISLSLGERFPSFPQIWLRRTGAPRKIANPPKHQNKTSVFRLELRSEESA